MKSKQFERLIKKYLLPFLNDFEVKGSLIFRNPLNKILKGFCFESSGFSSNTFYIYSFVQPLYVPSEILYFTYGDRIGRKYGSSFTLEKENENEIMMNVLNSINREGMKILKKMDNLTKVAKNLSKITGSQKNPRILEAIAYSLILENYYDKAVKMFGRIKLLIENTSDAPEWYNEILSRVDQMERLLGKNPNDALELLNQWSKYTVTNLKLQDFFVQ